MVSVIVLVQKVVPLSVRINHAIAFALIAYGGWVATVGGSGAMLTAVPR